MSTVWRLQQQLTEEDKDKEKSESKSDKSEDKEDWVVVSNIFYFQPYLGKWSNLTNIFQMGWNHQLEDDVRVLLRWLWNAGVPMKCCTGGESQAAKQLWEKLLCNFAFFLERNLDFYYVTVENIR